MDPTFDDDNADFDGIAESAARSDSRRGASERLEHLLRPSEEREA